MIARLAALIVSSSVLIGHAAATDCGCGAAMPGRFATRAGMASIPNGSFMMGGDNAAARADELPKHKVSVSAFWLDKTLVTNKQFKQFIAATHYLTTAEQVPDWEILKKQLPAGTPKPDAALLVPAAMVFMPPKHPVPLNNPAQWWAWVPGANWQHPRGPGSDIHALDDHPVVQVSWDDAKAFCQWANKRLPTEAEWEWAARGGLVNKIYPWGDEPVDVGTVKANTWQGQFPYQNTLRDKYFYTAPVGSFAANAYGLYDMAGNTWEWVNDWYRRDYYTTLNKQGVANPQGPDKSFDPLDPTAEKKVLRGGSFLCNESYCTGYRVAARMKMSPDTGMQHVGFRCAADSG